MDDAQICMLHVSETSDEITLHPYEINMEHNHGGFADDFLF